MTCIRAVSQGLNIEGRPRSFDQSRDWTWTSIGSENNTTQLIEWNHCARQCTGKEKPPAQFASVNYASIGIWRDSLRRIPPIGSRRSFLSRSEGLDHAEAASTCFMVASGGVLSEEYGHGGPGVCLVDGQTEAEGVPSQGGRGDAPLRRMPPYLTLTWLIHRRIRKFNHKGDAKIRKFRFARISVRI